MRIVIFILMSVFAFFFLNCHATVNVSVNEGSAAIIVKFGDSIIDNETGSYDFGFVDVMSSGVQVDFTIENSGDADLTLTSNALVDISGIDSTFFEVNTGSTEKTISGGESTTFSIAFKPTSAGAKYATISIENDSQTSPYTFTIVGSGIEIHLLPEINVKQDSDNIDNSTGTYDFGQVFIGNSSNVITFTIENLGDGILNLTGNPIVSITGVDATEFNVDAQLTVTDIQPSSNTSFTITFSPTSDSNKSALISIENNDGDENPYTFTVTGIGEIPYPEINVKQGTQDIQNSTGEFDFGTISLGNSSSSVKFTIENIGNADLELTGSPIVKITGSGSGDFSLNTSSTSSPVSPGNETEFEIQFTPSNLGNKQATITIENNDNDENPYVFKILGEGTNYVKGDFNGDGYRDFIVGAADSNDGGLYSGSAYLFFGKQNWSSSIDASNADVIFVGEEATDHFGYSTDCLGDVNNDGFADFAISATYNNSGNGNTGSVYIFFGKSKWDSSVDASKADVKIKGEVSFDRFGFSVSKAGDVNNDGIVDIIIGAYENDGGFMGGGCAYIFFGKSNWNSSIAASTADVKITGTAFNDYLGYSVSYAGDINNDGKDDVIIGALFDDAGGSQSGSAFIFFGRTSWNSSYSKTNADVQLIGDKGGDEFGTCVSNVGDMNNDGLDDVIVGAPKHDDGGANSGSAFIFFGRKNWSSAVDAANASVKLIGCDAEDFFGTSLSSAGDVDKDGISDFVVGAPRDDDGGLNAGCAFIFFGKSNWSSSVDASLASAILVGGDADDRFGQSVAIVGDINNDNYDDVIIGAIFDDDGGTESGCAFIFRGRKNWSSSIDATGASTKLIGKEKYDHFGYSASDN